MRVLHFGRFYHDYPGGLERIVATLLDCLSASITVDNLVANADWKSDVVHRGPENEIEVIRVPSLGVFASTALAPTMPLVARRLCKERQYDIVHLHLPDPLSCLCVLVLPRRVKVVVTWHSDVARYHTLFRLVQPLVNAALRRAAAVVAATPAHFSSSTQLGVVPASKRQVVPFGMDTKSYQPTAALKKQADRIRAQQHHQRIVFSLGRHVGYKGFPYLIRAMRAVPNTTLILGGSGPETQALRELVAELGLKDQVRLVGKIPDADLAAYYHACDVFCLPSITPAEAFALVQTEAMACGKPVVNFQIGNGVNFVSLHGKTGLTVPLKDEAAMARALCELLESPSLRRKFGKAARTRVEREFSLEKMTAGMLAVYEQVLGRQ